MRPLARLIAATAVVVAVAAAASDTALAQRRRGAPARRPVRPNAVVFVGGYFYDPFFGPHPWWARAAYPYPYYPVFDARAVVRVIATPKDAAVYADGFYAGTVHDFNDWWQGLPLTPGGHEIVLFLDGYRTERQRVYLQPGSSINMRLTLEPLPAFERSEPPVLAPPLPPPPQGTFLLPRTQASAPAWAEAPPPSAVDGTLSLRVEPANAQLWIDGEPWASSDGRHFVVGLSAGTHRVDVYAAGYESFATDVVIRRGVTTPLNVSLVAERR